MSLEKFTEKIKNLVVERDSLNQKVKFIFPEGVVYIDSTVKPNIVLNEDKKADIGISMSLENAFKFLANELSSPLMVMVMKGDIKITGSIGLAMKVVKAYGA